MISVIGKNVIWMVGATIGAMFVVTVSPELAMACEYCYGVAGDSEIMRGIGMAMGALIGITGIIGVGTFSFFRRMAVRTRLLEAGGFEVSQNGEMIDPQKLTP